MLGASPRILAILAHRFAGRENKATCCIWPSARRSQPSFPCVTLGLERGAHKSVGLWVSVLFSFTIDFFCVRQSRSYSGSIPREQKRLIPTGPNPTRCDHRITAQCCGLLCCQCGVLYDSLPGRVPYPCYSSKVQRSDSMVCYDVKNLSMASSKLPR